MQQLQNPITGQPVHEVITQNEATKRGYLTLEFLMAHLEDENESFKFFIIGDQHVIVNTNNPMTQYKKKPILDYSRILDTSGTPEEVGRVRAEPGVKACSLDDEGCISCSG
jgi:hypothetical protein